MAEGRPRNESFRVSIKLEDGIWSWRWSSEEEERNPINALAVASAIKAYLPVRENA